MVFGEPCGKFCPRLLYGLVKSKPVNKKEIKSCATVHEPYTKYTPAESWSFTDQSAIEREAPTFRKDNCSTPPRAQYVEARGMIEVSFDSL